LLDVLLWKVGIVSENCATIITSSPLPNEIDGSDHPDLTEAEVSRNLSDSFHVETSVVKFTCNIYALIVCTNPEHTYIGKRFVIMLGL
jgi:hypothetical protein